MAVSKGLILITVMALSSTSLAQIDTGPDGIGIYFDEAASIVSFTAPEETTVAVAYLILTNPSYEGPLYYWYAVVSSSVAIFGTPMGGHNQFNNSPGSETWACGVLFGQDTPSMASTITVLAELEILHMGNGEQHDLYVSEGASYIVWDIGGTTMNPSSGNWGLPVAVINGPAPVANEIDTWGGVKSLFR